MRRTRPLGPLPAGTSTTSRPGHPAHAGDPQESCGYGQSTRPCARRLTILSLPPPPLHPPAHSQPPPSLRPPPLALVILRGPAAGRTLAPSPAKAGATTLTVGRKAGRDFHIPDTSVSEQHALFEWEARPPLTKHARAGPPASAADAAGGAWTLRDVGSTNGTLHNGEEVVREGGSHDLEEGDVLVLGRHTVAVVQVRKEEGEQVGGVGWLHIRGRAPRKPHPSLTSHRPSLSCPRSAPPSATTCPSPTPPTWRPPAWSSTPTPTPRWRWRACAPRCGRW